MAQRTIGTYWHVVGKLLPLVATLVLLLVGLWIRWPIVEYEGPPTQDAITQYTVDRFAYSDIATLYYRDGLQNHPVPYLDYNFEYPVVTGFLVYLISSITNTLPEYFLLSSLALGAAALGTAVLIPAFPGERVWLFALSPALAFYVNLNWDMWGVLSMIAALLLFLRERDRWGAAVLAVAVWAKFFPIVFLPLVVADRLLHRGRQPAGRILVVFALASVALNAPVLLLSPSGWWHFFSYSASRGVQGESVLWTFFSPALLSTPEINRLIELLLAWGLVVLLMLQRRLPPGVWVSAGTAMLAWFFFVGKVYSPQYSLWIVTLLAVIGVYPALAVAWWGVDLLYFFASFARLGLTQFGEAQGWFVEYVQQPAIFLREGMLLIVAGWCVWQMRKPIQELTQHHGEY